METAADIPGAIEQLAAAISSVPPPILTVNQTLLSSLLAEVAQDLAPVWPSLAQAQEEALLTNSTFLASQLDSLSALLARSRADWTHASRADVLALIEISATRYNIWTVWAPECWAVVLMFGIAAGLKVALVLLLQRKAIERVVKVSSLALTHGEDTKPSVEAREIARVQLQKPARAACVSAAKFMRYVGADFQRTMQPRTCAQPYYVDVSPASQGHSASKGPNRAHQRGLGRKCSPCPPAAGLADVCPSIYGEPINPFSRALAPSLTYFHARAAGPPA